MRGPDSRTVLSGRDALAYGGGKAVPGVLGLVGVLLLVPVLRPAGYAVYGIGLTASLVAAALATGWLGQSRLRFAGHPRLGAAPPPRLVSLCAAGAAAACGVLLTVLGTALPLTAGDVAAAAVLAACTARHQLELAGHHAAGAAPAFARAECRRAVLALVLAGLAAALTGRAHAALLATAVATHLARGPHHEAAGRPGPRAPAPPPAGAERDVLAAWARFGVPLSLWLGGSQLLQSVDRYLLAPLVDTAALGAYSAAHDLVTRGTAAVLVPVVLASHHRVARAWNRGRGQEADVLLRGVLRWQLLAGGLAVAVVGLAGTSLGRVVPALDVLADPWLVLPLAVTAVLWQVALTAHRPLELRDRTATMLLLLLAALATKVALTALAGPVLGVRAAAAASLVAGLVYVLGCAVCLRGRARSDGRLGATA